MLSSRNEPKSLDTCSAKQGYAPQPNGERDTFFVPGCQTFLHRYDVCEAHSRDRLPLASQSDYHRLCPSTSFVANPHSASDVPRQWHQASPPTTWCRGHWQRQQPRLTARRQPRPKGCVLPRFSHDPWGLARHDPPKTRLAHHRIGCLPLPVYAAQFLAIGNQHRPYLIQHTQAYPPLKSAVHGAVVGKLLGQMVPLTAAAHAEDDCVQRRPWVDSLAAGVFGRVVSIDDWFYLVPQFIRYLPNRWQCFNFFSFSGHLRLLSIKVHRWFIGKIRRFEIVSK